MALDQSKVVDLVFGELRSHQSTGVLPGFASTGEDAGAKKRFPTSISLLPNIPVGGLAGEHGLDVSGIAGHDKLVVGNRDHTGVHIFAHLLVDGLDDVLGTSVGLGGLDTLNKPAEPQEPLGGHHASGPASQPSCFFVISPSDRFLSLERVSKLEHANSRCHCEGKQEHDNRKVKRRCDNIPELGDSPECSVSR
ncbi:hypothetical protein QC761_0049300 [Podospora bellae-mahoneyi]|uniref:Uncharacterized protein n=1 Tax=Podospora bellae-mahoneyi TaxID=2093777 RepID=A0ABR0FKY2_9PEZI|nr:hypothetical protein QC761_0049300 [Podospora bellae-mahoneyi]